MNEHKQNSDYVEFGERLKWLRNESALSQKELAEMLGMVQQTYHGYESGIRRVNLQLLVQLANHFNVSIDFLAGRTTDRKLHHMMETHNKWDEVSKRTSITLEDEKTLDLYNQLDDGDKGEVRGEMKQMLKSSKYSVKKQSRNA